MSESPIFFVKLIIGTKTDWLQEHYPSCFLLLAYIARHARRTDTIPDGLQFGDCIIGEIETPHKCGLSKKEFRTARDKLIEFNLVEIVFNPKSKNGQKRAIKRAIKSYIVNICNSEVFDATFINKGEQNGDEGANKGRSRVDKQREQETTDIKEQQQTLVPLPVEPVGSSVVCSFSCLDGLGLSVEDLQKLAAFDEVDVIRGVKVLKEYKKPIDSIMGYLLRAIKGKWQPKSNPVIQLSDRAISNREKLLKYASDAKEPLQRKDLIIMDCIDHAMFGTEKLPYEHEDFKELVKQARIKFNLWHSLSKPIVEDNIQNNTMSHASSHAMNLLHNSEHFKK